MEMASGKACARGLEKGMFDIFAKHRVLEKPKAVFFGSIYLVINKEVFVINTNTSLTFEVGNPLGHADSNPYLILVSTASTGGGVLFPAGVPFSKENTEGTVLEKFIQRI